MRCVQVSVFRLLRSESTLCPALGRATHLHHDCAWRADSFLLHRNRRRKCEITNPDVGCSHCASRGMHCTLAKLPLAPVTMAPSTWTEPLIISPTFDGIGRHHRESITDLPPSALCEELVDLYLFHISDKFHSLFHPPSLLDDVARGTLPKVMLFAIMSLGARSAVLRRTFSYG